MHGECCSLNHALDSDFAVSFLAVAKKCEGYQMVFASMRALCFIS